MTETPRPLPPAAGQVGAPMLHGVRRSMGGLALVGAVVTLVPGVLVYLGLRALGLGIGGAGIIGLVLEFVGCFAYCGWLFGRGRGRGCGCDTRRVFIERQVGVGMRMPRPTRRNPELPPPGVAMAFIYYTLLRFGFFAFAFLIAAAIIVPSTTGSAGPRLAICAVFAVIASIPLSLFLGRRRRDDLTAALLAQRLLREQQDREYDDRVRAARRGRTTDVPAPPGT